MAAVVSDHPTTKRGNNSRARPVAGQAARDLAGPVRDQERRLR